MKPVEQQILHDPDNDVFGDCGRACIASLLELESHEVPHFAGEMRYLDDNVGYNTAEQKFLSKLGLTTVSIQFDTLESYDDYCKHMFHLIPTAQVYHIICGPSPRFANSHHAIIGLNGEPYFDPHPDKTFLAGTIDQWYFQFLVVANMGAIK